MGKTFKSGYMSLAHSFNSSLYNFQCEKKSNRRKRKIALKNDCKWIVNDSNKSEVLNMTISNLAVKNNKNIKRPSKIGYCANSAESYTIIVNKILPNYSMGNHNGLSWVYEEERVMFEDDFQFKNLNETEKIEYLIEKEKNKNSKWNYLYELNNMKKQLKRRGAIGYFKGHNKDKK